MGRWNSAEATQRAANRVDMKAGRQVIDLEPGEGVVIHAKIQSYPPDSQYPSWIQIEADKALAIPGKDGTVHLFPIDETQYLYGPAGPRP